MARPQHNNSRGLLDHGAGKGSAPRHKLNKSWRDNYDAIDWGRPPCSCIDRPGGYLHNFFKEHYSPDLDTKIQ